MHRAWGLVDAGVLLAAAMAMSCGASAREANAPERPASGTVREGTVREGTVREGTDWATVGVMPVLSGMPRAVPVAAPGPMPATPSPGPAPRPRSPRVAPPGPPLLDHGSIDGFPDLRMPRGWRTPEQERLFDGRQLARKLRHCVDRQLRSNPDMEGKILLLVRLDERGRVVEVTSEHSPALAWLASCFRRMTTTADFEGTGEQATITIPIHIMAPR